MENSPGISSEISLCAIKYREVHVEGGREGFFFSFQLFSVLSYYCSVYFCYHINSIDSLLLPTGKTFKQSLNILLLLLLLSCFSRVRLCVTPETASHQAPPSLGFSRQEHWSGLPFPSPMHESEKWKWSRSVVSNSSRPPGLQPIRLLRPWDFPGKSTGVGCHCLLCLIS